MMTSENHVIKKILLRVYTNGEYSSVHYLRHRAIIKYVRETTKTCIVFDASSKVPTSPSLNILRPLPPFSTFCSVLDLVMGL